MYNSNEQPNLYIEEYNKAQSSGDINKQFHWLQEIANNLYKVGKTDEATHYLHIMLDLARKTDRPDQEMMAMISLKNFYYYVLKNDQEALRWVEKIHDLGVQINAIKETENICFLTNNGMLYGKEALNLINNFLSFNENTLKELRR